MAGTVVMSSRPEATPVLLSPNVYVNQLPVAQNIISHLQHLFLQQRLLVYTFNEL